MQVVKNFKVKRFLLLLLLMCILIFFSFLAIASADEGHPNNTFISKLLENSFYFFSFPMILLSDYATTNFFWVVLILGNAICYALLIELVIIIIQNFKKKKVE
jgi:hypothetical protein